MTPRFRFRPLQRLRLQRDIQRVRRGRCRASNRNLLIYAWPNALGRTRLGLAVGKKLGSAPLRNRQKRLIREAFRLGQHDLPEGYDLLCVVLQVERPSLEDYQRWLSKLVPAAVRQCKARSTRRRSPAS
jgi:ribonuclease P protein component